MKAQDIVRQELIGLTLEVVDANNPALIGIKGKVIDETKNTLTIETKNKTKKLVKKQVTIKLIINGKTVQIGGLKLTKRPEERIK